MTMKSVGVAANEMVKEVARQFREIPGTPPQIVLATSFPTFKTRVY